MAYLKKDPAFRNQLEALRKLRSQSRQTKRKTVSRKPTSRNTTSQKSR